MLLSELIVGKNESIKVEFPWEKIARKKN
jgi:hypothetical protein